MKKVLLITIIVILAAVNAHALTVLTKSTSSGIYQDGKFTSDDSSFEARYVIDEAAGTVRLEKILSNDRTGKITEGAVYDITNTVVGGGFSGLAVNLNKMHQRIITAVNDTDLGATEVIIMGEDFYEYCRAANGRFYLEHGEVARTGGGER